MDPTSVPRSYILWNNGKENGNHYSVHIGVLPCIYIYIYMDRYILGLYSLPKGNNLTEALDGTSSDTNYFSDPFSPQLGLASRSGQKPNYEKSQQVQDLVAAESTAEVLEVHEPECGFHLFC